MLKLDNLSSISGTHVKVEGENRPHKAVLWSPHVHYGMDIFSKIKKQIFKQAEKGRSRSDRKSIFCMLLNVNLV